MTHETSYTIITAETYKKNIAIIVCYINVQTWKIPSEKWLYIFVNMDYNAKLI
jgi:hypothetical protein